MVSCRELTQLYLDAWLSGDLPARRQRDCALHLHACAACTDYVNGYRQVVALLASRVVTARIDVLPEDLVQHIMNEIGMAR